jgi:hypothetical protein
MSVLSSSAGSRPAGGGPHQARELDKTHPGAAASLREGMAETLTILRLGVPPSLARTLLGDQRQAAHPVPAPPAHQQLAGLIPPPLAVAARAGLAADSPRPDPGHRALLTGQHRSGEQMPATATAGATTSSSAAAAAHSRTCHL